VSGNPKGRPPGRGLVNKLHTAMQATGTDGKTVGENLVDTVIAMAIGGDMQAITVIFNKLMPNAKATIKLSGKGSLTKQGQEVVKAMFAGEVEVSEADRALSTLLKQATIIERVDLEQRMTALEAMAGERQIEHVRPAETVVWPTKTEPVVETVEALVIDENGNVEIEL
jgi:hypothetical protein